MTRSGKKMRLLILAGILSFFFRLQATEIPEGILITKPDQGSAEGIQVMEYHSVTEHLIPATDYLTVRKINGDTESVAKSTVLQKVEYPRDTDRNIVSEAGVEVMQARVLELKMVIAQYAQAQKYLAPKIASLEKEINFFNQGQRKVNGIWITQEELAGMIAAEEERKAAAAEAKKRAEEAVLAKKRQAIQTMEKMKHDEEARIAAEKKKKVDAKAAADAKQKAEDRAKKAMADADAALKGSGWMSLALYVLAGCLVVVPSGWWGWKWGWKWIESKKKQGAIVPPEVKKQESTELPG